MSDRSFRLGAYATGHYSCLCTGCGERFDGDKHALACLPCAADWANLAIDTLRAENARLSKHVIGGVLGDLLDDDEQAALVDFVRHLRGKEPKP